MSSVHYLIMEREWFPRFILIYKDLLRRMNEHEEDYETVKVICQCESYCQVFSIVEAYNNDDFKDVIHSLQVLAKKAIARQKRQI